MKIKPEIDVFDDPEYCFMNEDECCGYLIFQEFNLKMPHCTLYRKQPAIYWTKEPVIYEKCDQCKADYLKAKQEAAEKLTPCIKCKKPRGEDEHGAYICPCPHCGDEIPF